MPADPLPKIPPGSNTFVDTNVFVYGLLGRSAECRSLLERCSREEIVGISSYSVLLEVTHKLMLADARQKVAYLEGHPDVVRSLRNYWTEFQRVLALNLLYLENEVSIFERAQVERESSGLLTIDSTSVSLMKSYGIQILATNDSAFDRVSGIKVYRPTDI